MSFYFKIHLSIELYGEKTEHVIYLYIVISDLKLLPKNLLLCFCELWKYISHLFLCETYNFQLAAAGVHFNFQCLSVMWYHKC